MKNKSTKNYLEKIPCHKEGLAWSKSENGEVTIEIKNKALEQNYRPLLIDGIRKILNGDTTLDELNRQLILY